jgi:hypothetical protein
MKYRLISLFLFLSIAFNLSAENYPITRPNSDSSATKVFVSFYVLDIENIDNKKQSFTLDVIIRLKWKDERISNVKNSIPLNEVWNPNIQLYNMRKMWKRFPEVVVPLPDNMLQYTQRYYVTLSSILDFRDFPFDIQSLPITLLSFGNSPDEVELVYESAGSSEKFSISDWEVVPDTFEVSVLKANLFDKSDDEILRPKLEYRFKASRFIQFYWWKVLSPLMIILFLSWAVFWIDPSQVGAQIGVSGTSILTLIAFLYKLDNILPPVSYLTRMDHFIFTALVLVFIAYLEALISTTFALNGKLKIASRMDIIFRVLYPFLFLIVIIVYWIR